MAVNWSLVHPNFRTGMKTTSSCGTANCCVDAGDADEEGVLDGEGEDRWYQSARCRDGGSRGTLCISSFLDRGLKFSRIAFNHRNGPYWTWNMVILVLTKFTKLAYLWKYYKMTWSGLLTLIIRWLYLTTFTQEIAKEWANPRKSQRRSTFGNRLLILFGLFSNI